METDTLSEAVHNWEYAIDYQDISLTDNIYMRTNCIPNGVRIIMEAPAILALYF